MNLYLEAFIRDARAIADQRGVNWYVLLGPDGVARRGQGWNLTQMVHASAPPTNWLNDFGTDRRTIEVLNSFPPPGPLRTYSKKRLSDHWQDLIKACAIDQLLVRRNTPAHVACQVVRPLRVLATCAGKAEPWTITVDDVAFAIETAKKVMPSGKLADLVIGMVKSILDPNHLTDNGLLSPALVRELKSGARRSAFTKSLDELRSDLEERKHAEKLPDRRAFWELVRIVFTEEPRSFLDLLRFAQVKTLILTGLRVGECTLLPADWKRYREYFDFKGRPAGETGGISRSLMLRHFAEKQRDVYEDSTALYETVQHVPLIFEEILVATLDKVAAATEPLRTTLRRQIDTGRILPQFEPGELVRIVELYTFLTGNPFFAGLQEDAKNRFISQYRRDYHPRVFEDIRAAQMETAYRALDMATYIYLHRLKGVPFRTRDGTPWEGLKHWDCIYVRVAEVEKFLTSDLPTKQSDSTPIKLSVGELRPWELLFLMPKRALAEGREGGICDVTRHCAVGRMDPQMMTAALCSNSTKTLFEEYGETDEDKRLTLNPHSLRHLQNTELFRLEIADTIITKRSNRRQLAQSYDYDHRSLAEELDQIDLKPEVEIRLGEKSATVARLIKAGKAHGPIVDAFRRIQCSDGENAALSYLQAEADGFHSTPWGHCINNFTVDPCPKHLECFSGCRHLIASGLTENRQNLVQIEGRLELAVHSIEARKSKSIGVPGNKLQMKNQLQAVAGDISARITGIGLENQLSHAKARLAGVRKLLATAPGQQVFPDGPDLSKGSAKLRGTVLDDVL